MKRCFFEEIVTFTNRLLSATTDSRVTSHSFKHTTLSWCAAYGLPEASRSLLGHHEVSSKPLMVYSRDMLSGPLQLYGSMLQNIRDDHFRPDESRTSRLVAFLEHAEHADNAPHPTPPDSMAGLASFEVMKKWMDRLFAMYSQVFSHSAAFRADRQGFIRMSENFTGSLNPSSISLRMMFQSHT